MGPNECVVEPDADDPNGMLTDFACNIGIGGSVKIDNLNDDFGSYGPGFMCGSGSWYESYISVLNGESIPMSQSLHGTFKPSTTGSKSRCNNRVDRSGVVFQRDFSPVGASHGPDLSYLSLQLDSTLTADGEPGSGTVSPIAALGDMYTCCDKFAGAQTDVKAHLNGIIGTSSPLRSILTLICYTLRGNLPEPVATSNAQGMAVFYDAANHRINWDQAQVNSAVASDRQSEIGILCHVLLDVYLTAAVQWQQYLPADVPLTAVFNGKQFSWDNNAAGIASYTEALAHNYMVLNLGADSSGALAYALSTDLMGQPIGAVSPSVNLQTALFSNFADNLDTQNFLCGMRWCIDESAADDAREESVDALGQ